MRSMAVLVPTYRRPDDLRRCLQALVAQTRPPDEVIVVHRVEDQEAAAVLRDFAGILPLRSAQVEPPGVVAALNHGLDTVSSEIVSITDDDAAPRPDWLARIARHFERDEGLAGLGGRDHIHAPGREFDGRGCGTVGKVQFFGRCIGGHHLGIGGPREVEFLKGVNMSFRRALVGAVRFDGRLRGAGAQVGNEMAFCLALRARGLRLVYDPDVAVDHYEGTRYDPDRRWNYAFGAMFDRAYNDTIILLCHLPALRAVLFLAWALLVGDRATPGLLQALRLHIIGTDHPYRRCGAALRGRLSGVRSHLGRGRG